MEAPGIPGGKVRVWLEVEEVGAVGQRPKFFCMHGAVNVVIV